MHSALCTHFVSFPTLAVFVILDCNALALAQDTEPSRFSQLLSHGKLSHRHIGHRAVVLRALRSTPRKRTYTWSLESVVAQTEKSQQLHCRICSFRRNQKNVTAHPRGRRERESETETDIEPRHITSHTTHAPPFPSAFGCVLDGSWYFV